MLRPPPRPTLFPYTTLFRSLARRHRGRDLQISDILADADLSDALLRLLEQKGVGERSEEHTSESSHPSISYAVFCLKKKTPSTQPRSAIPTRHTPVAVRLGS